MANLVSVITTAIAFALLAHQLAAAGSDRSAGRRPNRRVVREESASPVVNRRNVKTNLRRNVTESIPSFTKAQECASTVVLQGPPGREGRPGIPGLPGMPGIPGAKGECDCKQVPPEERIPNVRHCAWNHHNYQRSSGQIQSCSFIKKSILTSLRLEWHGVTRLVCQSSNSSCCGRWYFTIDGNECNNPAPIDSLVYVDYGESVMTVHRSQSVIGICRGATAGVHDISFNVGDCQGGYARGFAKTGWNSASRIIIEEIYSN